MRILDQIKEQERIIQDSIAAKIAKGEFINDVEASLYKLTDEDKEVMEILKKFADGVEVPGFNFKDFLGTPQASILIPRVIIGTMRKAADPVYLASNFYKRIKVNSGSAVIFPSIGVMKAHDVAEGQEIPQETIDWQLHKGSVIMIGKSGVRVQVSDDLVKMADWDIVGMLLSEAGRAMARHKEQKAFAEFMSHGWTVFDNDLYRKDPVQYAAAKTTGVDYKGDYNYTMSIEDFLDVIICVYNNEYTPTDLIMHPLTWTVFARNGLTGSLTAPYDREAKRQTPNAQFQLGPESIQGRLPFSFNVNLSPFAPIDKVNRTFDLFCIDRNNVGVLLVESDLATEEFRDPSRDLRNVKITERYGFGTYNEGRAVCSAKNISMAKNWPMPERYVQLDIADIDAP